MNTALFTITEEPLNTKLHFPADFVTLIEKSLHEKLYFLSSDMPEYGLSLTHVFVYKNELFDSVLIRENMGQRKHNTDILHTVLYHVDTH